MFVWMFHRISGLVLILLLSLQVVTGMLQGSTSNAASVKDVATLLHKHPAVNCVLVFCIIFHGLYGVRTMVLDLGAEVRTSPLLAMHGGRFGAVRRFPHVLFPLRGNMIKHDILVVGGGLAGLARRSGSASIGMWRSSPKCIRSARIPAPPRAASTRPWAMPPMAATTRRKNTPSTRSRGATTSPIKAPWRMSRPGARSGL